MANNFKNPPAFDQRSMGYETWKNEVQVWQLVTELKKEKQALAVSLSLTGNARESAMEIPAADLGSEDGMTKLFAQLDKVFLRDDKDRAYEAYKDFDTFHRADNMSMSDYILEFDKRYNKSKRYEMTLPEAVLAFKLLDNAVLSPQEKQLALTASSNLKYTAMKSALQRIFGETACASNTGNNFPSISVKQEPVFYTQQKKSGGKQPGTNPLNKFGKRTKCAICQSVYHWAKDCPEKKASVNMTECGVETVENCNLTLFTKEQPSANEIFVLESSGSAIIDTACTRTVCGEKWFKQFMEQTSKKNVPTFESNRAFKFGDGKVVHSFKRATIPAVIGNTHCKIDTEIVKADIPLLLSKSSLKKAETILDIKHDKAHMFNQPVDLDFTSSGHYCVNILDKKTLTESTYEDQEEVLQITENMSPDQKRKTLRKLHKQFGHANYNRLSQLLKSAGTTDIETLNLLDLVIQNCEICVTNKKAVPRPVVGLPLATDFNETVAVDLHELEHNVWYLHIIDEFTRFSAGSIMRSKRPSEFVRKFLEYWIAVYGAPKCLYSDNGGEFNNSEVRDMAENFNIEVKTTAAYSPWSNGLLERHNQTLTEILLKVKSGNNCDWDTALSWALMAKNAFNNVHGYSPYQLVFGRNPNLPNVLTDKPPALEGTTTSAIVGKHIEALHSARTAFTKSECSERIRRALRRQTRQSGNQYQNGDKVYYKRPDCKEWKGPGVVIGQDGAVVFVRHGGICIRVHQCRLTRVTPLMEGEEINKKEKEDTAVAVLNDTSKGGNDGNGENESENEIEIDDGVEQLVDDGVEQLEKKLNVKVGHVIKYKDIQSGADCVANVTGRAGKATGKNKNWYNLQYIAPDSLKDVEISVDLSKVQDLEISVDDTERNVTEENVMVLDDISAFNEAKFKELESWKNNDVYLEMEDTGQKCVSTRWVCSLKDTSEGIIPKARLVARGFEEINKDDIPKDSPTCGSDSLRVVLAVIAPKKWNVHTMDIKTAFLQGSEIKRDIYIKPPIEANCRGVVWKLRKCVYGLSDASLSWYNKVKEVLEQCGVHVSQMDPAVFFWKNDQDGVEGVLACHVDDFLWGGSAEFENKVVNKIRSTFCVGKEDGGENGSFQYVGIELLKSGENILLRQKMYQNNIQFIPVEKSRLLDKEAPVTKVERDNLQAKIGQILWVARQSRPDVVFDASSLASSLNEAKVKTLQYANKIIKNIKSESVTLKFQNLGHDKDVKLVIFSDSSLGNLPDGGTQGGHFIALFGDTGLFSPITWQSKRIRRVVRSTLAGETLAMADAVDNGIFVASLYTELMTGKAKPTELPIICITDCHSLSDAIKSTKQVTEKRLRIEVSSIRELIEQEQIKAVKWIDTKHQLADCLTKNGASCIIMLKALQDGVWWDKCLDN